MKLNIDCMRDVLLIIEQCGYQEMPSFQKIVDLLPDYSSDDISYSCEKLYEAEFIDAVHKNYMCGQCPIIKIKNITYSGHQFLDDIRNDNNWGKVKEIASSVGSISVNAISQIATSVISAAIHSNFGL